MPSMLDTPYPYPVPNSQLIKIHSLQKHFEGGYFNQTLALTSNDHNVQTSWGAGPALLGGMAAEPPKVEGSLDATLIYYLLTPDSYRGKMHMNLHSHIHLHHAGRALYTLIRPPITAGELPKIHRVILGPNIADDEVTQLVVPGGWWKASEIPEEDRLLLEAPSADKDLKERVGCLISEVVIPGWTPEQHQFIDEDKLKSMWGGKDGWETYIKYLSSAP